MSETPRPPTTPDPAERLASLLAQRATEGLSPDERAELQRLSAESGVTDDDALDYAAALLQRTQTQPLELPAAIRARVLAQAPRFLPRSDDATATIDTPAAQRRGSAGWAFAWGALSTAAVVALMFWLLPLTQPAAPDPNDWIVRDWSGVVEGYEQVTGEVRWSGQRQGGQMRFRGLPPNDPSQGQYQLWIVDPTRDDEPVDGGVFDVTYDGGEGDEAVIDFAAKLPVGRPTVFAVTYEKPGGVVVSEGPLLVVAAVDASG